MKKTLLTLFVVDSERLFLLTRAKVMGFSTGSKIFCGFQMISLRHGSIFATNGGRGAELVVRIRYLCLEKMNCYEK